MAYPIYCLCDGNEDDDAGATFRVIGNADLNHVVCIRRCGYDDEKERYQRKTQGRHTLAVAMMRSRPLNFYAARPSARVHFFSAGEILMRWVTTVLSPVSDRIAMQVMVSENDAAPARVQKPIPCPALTSAVHTPPP